MFTNKITCTFKNFDVKLHYLKATSSNTLLGERLLLIVVANKAIFYIHAYVNYSLSGCSLLFSRYNLITLK